MDVGVGLIEERGMEMLEDIREQQVYVVASDNKIKTETKIR